MAGYYDMARGIQTPDIAGNFLNAYGAARQNKLAEQQLAAQQQKAAAAEQAKVDETQLRRGLAQAQWVLSGAVGKEQVAQAIPEFVQGFEKVNGVGSWANADENAVKQFAQVGMTRASAMLGEGPPAAPKPAPYVNVGPGGRVFAPQPDGSLAVVAEAPFKPDRPRAPAAASGGPQGLGKPPAGYQWITGPDGSPRLGPIPGGPADKGQTANARPMSAADAKAQREARAKMPTLEAAERRMTALSAAVRGLESNALFDGGPVDRLALALTEDGQRIKALSSQLLPVLTALTRVPGIGSQSDLETRLNGLQFPSTEYPPAVNRELAAELDTFIKDLRAAAERVANGEDFQPAAPASAPAAAPAASGGDWVDLGNGIKVKRK